MGLLAPLEIFAQTWHEFSKTSTICGVSNAGTARSGYRRSYWLFIFLLGLVGTVYVVSTLIGSFLTYPVSTIVSLKKYPKANEINFPGVTVCNQNRIDCDRLEKVIANCTASLTNCPLTTEALNIMKSINKTSCSDGTNNNNDPGIGNSFVASTLPPFTNANTLGRKKRAVSASTASPFLLTSASYNYSWMYYSNYSATDQLYGLPPPAVDNEYKFLQDYLTLNETDRQRVGHSFTDFIKSCTFRERDCLKEENFFLSSNPSYGNCYTFNSASNHLDKAAGKRITSMSGPSFGLQMVLNLGQANYLANGGTKQAGARLVVHDALNRALIDEYGNDVTPNTLTRVAIQQVNMTRLPAPYVSNCSSEWENTNYTDYLPTDGGWGYTLALCNRICLQSSFEIGCDCFHPLFLDTDYSKMGLNPCNLTSGSNDSICVTNIIEELDNATRNCSCFVNCEELGYELSLSTSKWPSAQYLNLASQAFGYANAVNSTDPAKMAVNNLLQIQVYFTTLNFQEITEKPLYSWEDGSYVSAFGGALSLFLGVAIVSVFEILELFLDYCINIYRYCIKCKKLYKNKEKSGSGKGNEGGKQAVLPYPPSFEYVKPQT